MDVLDYAGAKMDWCYIPDNKCLESASRGGELQGGALVLMLSMLISVS